MFKYGRCSLTSSGISELTPLVNRVPGSSIKSKSILKKVKKEKFHHVSFKEKGQFTGLRKNLTLANVVCSIVSSSIGAGIFISPASVTQYAGSVGASLMIWLALGIFCLLLGLCYCELGTALPFAGGDYVYIKKLLGPLPAFLCLWVTSIFSGPAASALMAKTASDYFIGEIGLKNQSVLSMIISVWINITFAGINMVSIKMTTRLLTFFTVIKGFAFACIISIGLIALFGGGKNNFENAFIDSQQSPSKLVLAFLPGFVAYAGWGTGCCLTEEMKNPNRDLPIATVIAIILITAINIMMNVAYFAVLTVKEFLESTMVALTFAEKIIPDFALIIPLFVVLSAVGAILGTYLGVPRYTYAGGKEGQLPVVLGYIHKDWFSPLPAIALQCVISVMLCSMPFLNIDKLLEISGIFIVIRSFLTLTALMYMKIRQNHLERSLKIPMIVVLICNIMLLALVILAIWEEPYINGLGFLLFLLGIPLYYLRMAIGQKNTFNKFMNKFTKTLQLLLLVIPSS